MDKKLVSRQFPARKMIDAGVHVAASTDAPCMYPDWKDTIQSAVLRKSKISGKVFGPEQRISVSEAIRMFTIEAAWFDNLENQKGSIESGKLADMCILDKDILDIDPNRILEIKNIMTIVGGKIVFDDF